MYFPGKLTKFLFFHFHQCHQFLLHHKSSGWVIWFLLLSFFCFFYPSDDEVPPLSAIYPLSGYEDPSVVASINGIHSQLSGGEESMTLKDKVGGSWSSDICCCRLQCTINICQLEKFDIWICTVVISTPLSFSQSSRGSSSSSSSSEGDEGERECGGEPPGQESPLSGGKNDCPPPSYPHSQVELRKRCFKGDLFMQNWLL